MIQHRLKKELEDLKRIGSIDSSEEKAILNRVNLIIPFSIFNILREADAEMYSLLLQIRLALPTSTITAKAAMVLDEALKWNLDILNLSQLEGAVLDSTRGEVDQYMLGYAKRRLQSTDWEEWDQPRVDNILSLIEGKLA